MGATAASDFSGVAAASSGASDRVSASFAPSGAASMGSHEEAARGERTPLVRVRVRGRGRVRANPNPNPNLAEQRGGAQVAHADVVREEVEQEVALRHEEARPIVPPRAQPVLHLQDQL